jgi:hypothetical protein
MSDEERRRDRVAYLRQLAVDSLKSYSGGFAELHRIDRDLKSIIQALEDVADPTWTCLLFGQWGRLEIIYASALAHGRYRLAQGEEADVQGIVAGLLAEFHIYELPLNPGDKPREYDVVRLLRPLAEHDLAAGSRGTVVVDYTQYSGGALPPAYEVEFADSAGITENLVTISGDDLEVVWRPGYGKSPP